MPPKAMIFNDPTHTEYDAWDFKLVKAYHFLQDYTSGSFPIWWDESDRVTFDVKSKVSKSRAAIARAEQKQNNAPNSKPTPGKYFYAIPRPIDGGPMPTFDEWVKEQEEKAGR
jgi:hypothetical protein